MFDTLLVFENYPDGDADDDGLAGHGTDGHDATHYPLTLIAEPGPRLHLAVEYRPDLFDSGYATRLAEALVTVVDGLVDGLDAPVGRVGLLDRAGRGGDPGRRDRRDPRAARHDPAGLVSAQVAATRTRSRWSARTASA